MAALSRVRAREASTCVIASQGSISVAYATPWLPVGWYRVLVTSYQPTGWRRAAILFFGFFGWLVVIPAAFLLVIGVGLLLERF